MAVIDILAVGDITAGDSDGYQPATLPWTGQGGDPGYSQGVRVNFATVTEAQRFTLSAMVTPSGSAGGRVVVDLSWGGSGAGYLEERFTTDPVAIELDVELAGSKADEVYIGIQYDDFDPCPPVTFDIFASTITGTASPGPGPGPDPEPSPDEISYNCACDDATGNSTLAELRSRIIGRLGFLEYAPYDPPVQQ